jgi:hypothetical protein
MAISADWRVSAGETDAMVHATSHTLCPRVNREAAGPHCLHSLHINLCAMPGNSFAICLVTKVYQHFTGRFNMSYNLPVSRRQSIGYTGGYPYDNQYGHIYDEPVHMYDEPVIPGLDVSCPAEACHRSILNATALKPGYQTYPPRATPLGRRLTGPCELHICRSSIPQLTRFRSLRRLAN